VLVAGSFWFLVVSSLASMRLSYLDCAARAATECLGHAVDVIRVEVWAEMSRRAPRCDED